MPESQAEEHNSGILPVVFTYCIPIGIVLYLCAPHLADEIWYDEAYTLIHYASGDILKPFTDYSAPNNHVLFSACLTLWQRMLGGEYNIAMLRLLPLLTLSASLILLISGTAKLADRKSAAVAALLFGTSHVVLNFSLQLRGYPFSWLPVSAAFFALAYHLEQPRWWTYLAYTLASVIAVATLPTNVIPVLCLSAWAAFEIYRRDPGIKKNRTAMLWLFISPALGGLAYINILKEMANCAATFKTGFTVSYVTSHYLWATLVDYWWLAPFFLLGCYGIVTGGKTCIADSGKDKAPNVCAPCPIAMLLACIAVPLMFLLAMPNKPFPRNLIPLLPIWYASLGMISTKGLERLGKTNAFAAAVALCLALTICGKVREGDNAGYADRYTSEDRPQDLYDLYYMNGFKPREILEIVDEAAKDRSFSFFADNSDLYSLIYIIANQYGDGFGPYKTKVHNYESIARGGLTDRSLSKRPLFIACSPDNAIIMAEHISGSRINKGWVAEKIADTGFFKLYAITKAEESAPRE
ncbi:MAG: hypothetical protein JXR97_08500 [Planctomycetes bacterium]|nr:hypothetical protein [Planctomycetota bacterium]